MFSLSFFFYRNGIEFSDILSLISVFRCAMALVHQRIRRIFYAFPNLNAGALGSVYRLQGEKSLNHRFAVFRVMLPEEVLDVKL